MASSRDGLFLGIDVGTQSTKALVLDAANQQVVGRGAVAYGLIEGLPPGAMEQHPQTWIDAMAAASRQALLGVDASRVRAIGVSGQQHGAVVLDERDDVVRPAKLWCDTSTHDEAALLSKRLSRPVPTGFTASKLAWLKQHEPHNWRRARRVMLPHDYVNLRLTGEFATECGDASGTGYFDVARRAFDLEAAAAIDPALPSMLPRMLQAGEPIGRLSAHGAQLLGVPMGALVSSGGGDNMMAAIGSGAASDGVVVISLGTSGTVFVRSSSPVIDRGGLVAPFCSSDGAWLPLMCVMNLTGVTESVRALTGLSHAELTQRASAVGWGSGGLCWIPFLNGERVPDLPLATGTLLGMRGDNLSPGHLYRAALEGTSCNLALSALRLASLGVPLREVRLCGGASKNPLWRSVLADLLDAPVRVVAEPEAAALGAAIQALWTLRRHEGESVSCADVASPFVRTEGDPVQPSRDRSAAANVLRVFADAVEQHHGVRVAEPRGMTT
ncbi:MAG: hypothetical protein RLZZ562_2373 [Planctomycetota bacterium]|jgi:xylulokinase